MRDRLVELWRRLRDTLSRGESDAESAEELEFHLEMATQRNITRGMPSAQARREALLRFGGVDRHAEAVREARRLRWLEDFWQDAVHGVRLLRRSPAFATAALLTLALGIGANTAIFSVLDAVLLRPLPYSQPHELISFEPDRYDAYEEWSRSARSLESSGAYTYTIATVTGGAEPQRVWALAVSSTLLPTLGVAPVHGRGFGPEDDVPGAPLRVLLRHGFWQSQFGGDASIVGATIDVLGAPHEVIGILPPELEFPPPARRADGAMPQASDVWLGLGRLSDLRERGGIFAVGRLAGGWTVASARAELDAIANASRAPGARPVQPNVVRVDESVVAPLRPAILAFAAGIALVLLVACANLSSMLLARYTARSREMAVRTSLGAPRGRIVRQVVAEGATLALGGSVAALALARVILDVLVALAPPELARIHTAGLSPRVLLVTLALGCVTAVLISVLPAWAVLRRAPGEVLGPARAVTVGRGGRRVQNALITSEVTFAVMLLVTGGLLLRSFLALSSVDPGFDESGLITADVMLATDRYATRADVLDFFDRLEERTAGSGGITSISAIDRLPYGPSYSGVAFSITGRASVPSDDPPRGSNTAARPGYFRTMGIPILAGREFTPADVTDGAPVAVISRVVAERYWPGEDPVGDRIVVFGREYEVVGVAGDVRHQGPLTPVDPLIYLPHAQDVVTRRMMTIVARTEGSAAAAAALLRSRIREIDPLLPIANLRTFDALESERTAGQRFNALLVSSFAALALVLAFVGIYGVLGFVVSQGRREIGVRMALGATRGTVVRSFMRAAMLCVAAGIVAGVAIAVQATGLIRSMLFGVPPTDVATYAAATALVLVITAVAAWAPARRAARVEPNIALTAD